MRGLSAIRRILHHRGRHQAITTSAAAGAAAPPEANASAAVEGGAAAAVAAASAEAARASLCKQLQDLIVRLQSSEPAAWSPALVSGQLRAIAAQLESQQSQQQEGAAAVGAAAATTSSSSAADAPATAPAISAETVERLERSYQASATSTAEAVAAAAPPQQQQHLNRRHRKRESASWVCTSHVCICIAENLRFSTMHSEAATAFYSASSQAPQSLTSLDTYKPNQTQHLTNRTTTHAAPPKQMDFSKWRQRYVALHVMYLGSKYQGLARQADSENTIEAGVVGRWLVFRWQLRVQQLLATATAIVALCFSPTTPSTPHPAPPPPHTHPTAPIHAPHHRATCSKP